MGKKKAAAEKPGKTNGNGANLGFEAKLWLSGGNNQRFEDISG